jgi:hypothetical protein
MLTNLKAALSVALILAAMAASKHAFRHQTSTIQQGATVSPFSSPVLVRSTIQFRSTGRANQPGNFKIEDTDYDEYLDD